MSDRVRRNTHKEAEKTERAQKAAALRSLNTQMRVMQADRAAAERLANAKVQAEQRAIAQQTRIRAAFYRFMERQDRQAERSRIASERTQLREAQRTHRDQMRMSKEYHRARREMMGGLAAGALGAVAGAGVAAAQRVDAYAGAFGAQSSEQKLVRVAELERRRRLLSDQAGLSSEQSEELRKRVFQTAVDTGKSPEELMAGMERSHAQFTSLETFMGMLGDLGKIAVSANADVDDVVGAMGVMRRQFQLTDDQMRELGAVMVEAADKGSIEFRDLAGAMVGVIGEMGRSGSLPGFDGVKTALGIAEVLGQSDMGAETASMLGVNLMWKLKQGSVKAPAKAANVQRAIFDNFGVNVADDMGALRDIKDLIAELSAAGFMKSENSNRRFNAFHDAQARTAIEVLVSQYEKDRPTFDRLMSLSPEQGQKSIDRRFASMMSGEEGQLATFASRDIATFADSDEYDALLKTTLGTADAMTQLQAEFPLFAEQLKIASYALTGWSASVGLVGAIKGKAAAAKVATLGLGASAAPLAVLAGGLFVGSNDAASAAVGNWVEEKSGLNAMAQGLAPMMSLAPPAFTPAMTEAPAFMRGADPAELARALGRDGAPDLDFVSKVPGDATLTIKVDGPGRITSVRERGDMPVRLDTGSNFGVM